MTDYDQSDALRFRSEADRWQRRALIAEEELAALRTRIAELEAQWASVPWEALWRIYNGQADDDAWIDYGDWLLAYSPGDESL